MDTLERKLRWARLLAWIQGDLSQSAFAKKIKIHQSAISGYLNPNADSRSPSKPTERAIVEYLQANHDHRWSVQELETYLESSDSIEKFVAKLSKKHIPEERLSLDDRLSMLSIDEKLDKAMSLLNEVQRYLKEQLKD